jgi:hypothetical protein
MLFGWLEICCWNHREVLISNSYLDVEIMEFNVLLSYDNMKLCTYMNSRIYILEHDKIIFCTCSVVLATHVCTTLYGITILLVCKF